MLFSTRTLFSTLVLSSLPLASSLPFQSIFSLVSPSQEISQHVSVQEIQHAAQLLNAERCASSSSEPARAHFLTSPKSSVLTILLPDISSSSLVEAIAPNDNARPSTPLDLGDSTVPGLALHPTLGVQEQTLEMFEALYSGGLEEQLDEAFHGRGIREVRLVGHGMGASHATLLTLVLLSAPHFISRLPDITLHLFNPPRLFSQTPSILISRHVHVTTILNDGPIAHLPSYQTASRPSLPSGGRCGGRKDRRVICGLSTAARRIREGTRREKM